MEDEQRSVEWFAQRVGMLTSSRAGKILNGTPRGWQSLMTRMKGEIDLGTTDSGLDTQSLEWGRKNEPRALAAFELMFVVDTVVPGFVTHPVIPYIGASPDFFLGLQEGGEIKCPWNPNVHQKTILTGMPKEHIPQIQHCLWVSCRAGPWHFISYDPRHPDPGQRLYHQEVPRDDAFIEKMARRFEQFWQEFQAFLNGDNRAGDALEDVLAQLKGEE